MGAGVFGFYVRSIAVTEAAPGLLELLGGLFLRCLVRRWDQHLRQKRSCRFLWQRGRIVYSPHLLRPFLGLL